MIEGGIDLDLLARERDSERRTLFCEGGKRTRRKVILCDCGIELFLSPRGDRGSAVILMVS
jgi:hypothetical protein